ncbi:MAG: hypothetical protein H0T79_05240 [Deltaproteobacteria bacterium]|nr:hypothetical protein [Deltaproteobacteria bacterium]
MYYARRRGAPGRAGAGGALAAHARSAAAGFLGLSTEWWHFDAPDSAKYALSNEPL